MKKQMEDGVPGAGVGLGGGRAASNRSQCSWPEAGQLTSESRVNSGSGKEQRAVGAWEDVSRVSLVYLG